MLKKGSSYFHEELSLIENQTVREFVQRILDNDVYIGNFINPASSTGKYHPSFSNDKNGLVLHTKALIIVVDVLLQARPDIDKDTIIASCILHDMMKYSADSQYTHTDHAELMYNFINRFYIKSDTDFNNIKSTIKNIALIIRYHMGYFGSDNIETYLKEITNTKIKDMILIVHYADMIVSRKWFGEDIKGIIKSLNRKR